LAGNYFRQAFLIFFYFLEGDASFWTFYGIYAILGKGYFSCFHIAFGENLPNFKVEKRKKENSLKKNFTFSD